jgi:hypothetical protein
MGTVLAIYHRSPLTLADGQVYTAQACGRIRDDGIWEGWLEFVPHDGSDVLHSARETTQPKFTDLEYWAAGLTPVYLRGALERTLTPPTVLVEPPPAVRSVFDEPAAPSVPVNERAAEAEPVLDPFSVYAKGEDLLRRQLGALSPRHLRAIIVGYDLVDPKGVDLSRVTAPELIALIVAAVRQQAA